MVSKSIFVDNRIGCLMLSSFCVEVTDHFDACCVNPMVFVPFGSLRIKGFKTRRIYIIRGGLSKCWLCNS